jgi:hypothetical protein
MKVVAYAPDLMDGSKLRSAGADLVRGVDDLIDADADVVVVDLGRPGVLEAVGALAGRTIGFCRHTDTDLIAAAEAAGCDEVLVRSVFFKRLSEGTAWSGDAQD